MAVKPRANNGAVVALCEQREETGTVHVAQLPRGDSLTRKRTCHFPAVPRCIAEIVFYICGRSAARLPNGGKDDDRPTTHKNGHKKKTGPGVSNQ